MKDLLYKALEDKFEADKSHAIATLELSFSRPVAIGEHPTLLVDMAKLVSDVATAEENLAALRDNFGVKAFPEGVTAKPPTENPDAGYAGYLSARDG